MVIDWLFKYVIMDARDNSVAFSKGLLRSMRQHTTKDMGVLVIKVSGTDDYGFFIGPQFKELSDEVRLPNIQYDYKSKRYGFNCFCPSVARLAYEWGMPIDRPFECMVSLRNVNGQLMYHIHKP